MHSVAIMTGECFDFISATYLGYMINKHADLFDVNAFLAMLPEIRDSYEIIKSKSPRDLRTDIRAALKFNNLIP